MLGFKLSGDYREYPRDTTDPHPGIDRKRDMDINRLPVLSHELRTRFHPVTGSLIFSCYLFPGLWEVLCSAGVSEQSYLFSPVQGKDGPVYETLVHHQEGIKACVIVSLEISSIVATHSWLDWLLDHLRKFVAALTSQALSQDPHGYAREIWPCRVWNLNT